MRVFSIVLACETWMILRRRERHVERSFRNTWVNSAGVFANSNFGEESRAASAGDSDTVTPRGQSCTWGFEPSRSDRSRTASRIDVGANVFPGRPRWAARW